MKKKLTIGIPTYNRKKKLINQVEFFISQGVLKYDDVEVIISDNASNDGTKEYLEYLSTVYPQIRVNINDTNIGGDLNVAKLTKLAKGEYIWFVGDDDDIHPGILENILSILKANLDLSWIFIKFNCLTSSGLMEFDLEYEKKYVKGIDLFKKISYSDYKLGGLMFVTASVHKTANALKVVKWYENSDECVKYHNITIPLGMSFYSALSGPGMATDFIGITNNIFEVSWNKLAKKVFCRDQIAMLDNIAKLKNYKLLKIIDLRKGLEFKNPEWSYIRAGYSEDNYAFKFYLKNKPTQIVYDFFDLLFGKFKRRIKGDKG